MHIPMPPIRQNYQASGGTGTGATGIGGGPVKQHWDHFKFYNVAVRTPHSEDVEALIEQLMDDLKFIHPANVQLILADEIARRISKLIPVEVSAKPEWNILNGTFKR